MTTMATWEWLIICLLVLILGIVVGYIYAEVRR
jgi:uncharacterized protein YneF (UPF0154 family)